MQCILLAETVSPQTRPRRFCSFASDQASFITGVILPVDGGIMAGRQ
jgi:hypothetical protein